MQTLQHILPEILSSNREISSFMIRRYRSSGPKGVLKLFDDSVDNFEYHIITKDFDFSLIHKYLYSDGWDVGLSSRVITPEGIYYIPIMDFQICISEENKTLLTTRLKEVFLLEEYSGGWLLQTNNSYHFIGRKIVTFDKWLCFIGRMLQLRMKNETAAIADDKYIGYSLLRKDTPCRFSPKSDQIPFLVDEIIA